MKKGLKVGLYDPFLDTLGGGELHVLSMLEVLSTCGFEPTIFWNKNLTDEIKEKFSLHYINKINWVSNIFTGKLFPFSALKTLQTLQTFDCFIYVTDGSYFFSSAKKNYAFCMVPDRKLYDMNFINRLKTLNYCFITNSQFTGSWLKHWGIDNHVLYPYVSDVFLQKPEVKKEKIILSVGRFFPHLHSKQYEVMINMFNNLIRSDKNIGQYRLILAGGLKDEDEKYFNTLQTLVKDNPHIELKPNLPLKELTSLYQKAEFFWHFTGYGVDENIHPEMVEHLGITPLEAMASGCITFCYNAGGPKEIIIDGKNGFLFNTPKELFKKMELGIRDEELGNKIRNNARNFVKDNFSYEVFEKKVQEIFI